MQRYQDSWADGEQPEVIREGTTQLCVSYVRTEDAKPEERFTQADFEQALERVSRRQPKRGQASS